VAEVAVTVVTGLFYIGWDEANKNVEYAIPFIATIVIILGAMRRGKLSQALYHPWLAPLRPISYAIYLVHPLVIFTLRYLNWDDDVTWPYASVYFVGVMASAFLLHRLIERPGIQAGRWLTSAKVKLFGVL
jgi:peptidoglycan/LPS O-acetylase OafA/YrhL